MKFRNILCFAIIVASAIFAEQKQDSLGSVAFSISPEKYGIKIESDGESVQTGPLGFSVLGENVALLNTEGNTILVISRNGQLLRKVKFGALIGHFDLDSNGNGFAAVNSSLYSIHNFIPSKNALKVKFSIKGNTQGKFRIDLLGKDRVKFVSYSPNFIVDTKVDSVGKAIEMVKTSVDSIIINDLSNYAGENNGYNVFLRYNRDSTGQDFIKILAVNNKDSAATFSKKFDAYVKDLGCFIEWSYWLRMDESRDAIYVMLYKDKHILIREFNLHKLLGI